MKTTIAIARQLGSGGSYAGQRIAAHLGFRYVDRDVLKLAAQELNCAEEDLAGREECLQSFWDRLLAACSLAAPSEAAYVPPPIQPISDLDLFHKEVEIMNQIAAQGDCLLMGRAATYVLEDLPGTIKILLHAPAAYRVQRVREIYNVASEKQARTLIEQSDEMRRKFVFQMTGVEWMRVENYHLAFDTSLMSLNEISDIIIDYVRRRQAGDTGTVRGVVTGAQPDA